MVRSRTAFAVTIVASILAASGPAASADVKSKRPAASGKDAVSLVHSARRGRTSKPKPKPKPRSKPQRKQQPKPKRRGRR